MKLPAALLLLLCLSACASAPPKAPTTGVSSSGAKKVCSDDSPTGSNIHRHRCELLTEEQQHQRQQLIDALQRRSGVRTGSADAVH